MPDLIGHLPFTKAFENGGFRPAIFLNGDSRSVAGMTYSRESRQNLFWHDRTEHLTPLAFVATVIT